MKGLMSMLWLAFAISCMPVYIPKTYRGKPWKTQALPGKIECELYDKGGEGVAYHDNDSVNNGSGKLNPANGSFLNEFRMKEGADISYTKSGGIDDNPFNKYEPVPGQFYLGWTEPGEWVNYTIKVTQAGSYRAALVYTANGQGAITLDVDNRQAGGPLKINSTHNDADTVAWRQWHHWNRIDSLTTIVFTKGIHLLTMHITEHGNMNFDYLEFSRE